MRKGFGLPHLISGLTRLLRDEEGSYLLIVSVAISGFIGLAGLATEGALIFYYHRAVQSAADSAAYSAAVAYSIDNSADITTEAQAIVADYGFVVDTASGNATDKATVVATVDTITYSPLTAINVAITRPQTRFFSSFWIKNSQPNGASAKAIISGGAGGGNGNCILSIAPTGSGIKLQGTPSITAPGCGVFSNSNGSCSGGGGPSTPSIDLGGNGSITAGSVGAAGCVSVGGSSNIGPPPTAYTGATPACPTCADNPVINPYSGITPPSPGTCLANNAGVVRGNGNNPNKPVVTATLSPGTYCTGGISVTNHANVTLNPGVYILNGPVQLVVDSQSSLTGTGVTLVFTDPGGAAYPHGQCCGNDPVAMNISSGADINLTAPTTSGPTEGMLIIGNSNIPTDTRFNLQANGTGSSCTSTNCIGGVIYVPTADFTWGGGPILAGGCTQMIAYRVIMGGNAQFNNSNCNLAGGGGGAKPIGNVVTLVR